MNKKYKPKKPIVYDIDRSLLHTASRNILNAINNDTIIGQPTFHNKPIKVGTEKVQVGTEKVQVGTKKVQVGTEQSTIELTGSGVYIMNPPDSQAQEHTNKDLIIENNTNRNLYLETNDGRKYYINIGQRRYISFKNIYSVTPVLWLHDAETGLRFKRSVSGGPDCAVGQAFTPDAQGRSHPIRNKPTITFSKPVYEDQPVYEDRPVYENKPVYKDSPVKGLIMYLRRKKA